MRHRRHSGRFSSPGLSSVPGYRQLGRGTWPRGCGVPVVAHGNEVLARGQGCLRGRSPGTVVPATPSMSARAEGETVYDTGRTGHQEPGQRLCGASWLESQRGRSPRPVRPAIRRRGAGLGRGVLQRARHPLRAVEFRTAQRPLAWRSPRPCRTRASTSRSRCTRRRSSGPGRSTPSCSTTRGCSARRMLLRDKALMKRRAQLGGIRVGIFEEAHDRDDVIRFLKRVNQTLLKLDGDPNDPIHLKAFDKAGMPRAPRHPHPGRGRHDPGRGVPGSDGIPPRRLGVRGRGVDPQREDQVPQHLRIRHARVFGVRPGDAGTGAVPRRRSRAQIEKLIKTFDIEFGFVHPEYFVTSDGEMYFGEVAYRPPGFKVFELLERAYGFNAYQGLVLAFDPKTTEEEIDAFFPREVVDASGVAGCFGVYPRRRVVSELRDPGGDRGRRLLRVARPLGAAGGDRHQEDRVRHPLGPAVLLRRRPVPDARPAEEAGRARLLRLTIPWTQETNPRETL